MDYSSFLSHDKVLLVAPAGYGKTFTLAQCLKHTTGKSLILTHTHAGVASIKKKLKDEQVDTAKFNVETISSFAQKYVQSFYSGSDAPEQDDRKNYHPFILTKAIEILSISAVHHVVTASYTGIFVDEYQDCTHEHHSLIMTLAKHLPLRIFGDALQGIFNFNGDLVDFSSDLDDFYRFPPLSTPHRWELAGNAALGKALDTIRRNLEEGEDIDLSRYDTTIEYVNGSTGYYVPGSPPAQKIKDVRKEGSLLIIHPNTVNLEPRLKFSSRYKDITPIESIDDKTFYRLARAADEFDATEKYPVLKKLAGELYTKTEVDKWFGPSDFKNKRGDAAKGHVNDLKNCLGGGGSLRTLSAALEKVADLPAFSCTRKELLRSLNKAIDIAMAKNLSVYEGMKEQRNNVRRAGRKIEGRHIGTTLLTKGLEFDTVVVLDAHRFECPKHLYVALTRCRKRLVVIANTQKLSPYRPS
ncbi:hypothetical protein EY643_09820 [Halioglobus maricola]|uniref:Uncharacterized protein n=1 Tax=Halioglobus maricola TaxID=2601894 RepID=A0A5P9NL22_9GAMM|nr:UvrD-helicase domain-containing protein [Halioglobus maricola]QFU75934.1 hypothetical protein EY643_09820 [Halioglobus maricola]